MNGINIAVGSILMQHPLNIKVIIIIDYGQRHKVIIPYLPDIRGYFSIPIQPLGGTRVIDSDTR